jgi:hypothetical protein
MKMREKLLSQVRRLLSEIATQAFPSALPVDIKDITKVIQQLRQEQMSKESEISAAQKEPDPNVRSTRVAQLQGELGDIIAQKSQLVQMQKKSTTSEAISQISSNLKISRVDLMELVREQLDDDQAKPVARQQHRNRSRERMKITKAHLRQIINEEINRVLDDDIDEDTQGLRAKLGGDDPLSVAGGDTEDDPLVDEEALTLPTGDRGGWEYMTGGEH